MNYDDPSPCEGDVNRPGDAVPPSQPHLPELTLQVLDVRRADPLQTDRFDALGKTQKGRLYVLGQ